MNTTSNTIDVLIVGAGPVGLACGIAAKRAGLESAIIESESKKDVSSSLALFASWRESAFSSLLPFVLLYFADSV